MGHAHLCRIDTPGVIQRVSMLFQGNHELLLGFNAFLPEGHKMPTPTSAGNARLLGLASMTAPGPDMGARGALGGAFPPSGTGGYVGAGYPEKGRGLGMGLGLGGQGGGDVNYAVNFVAKVKQRFVQEPDKYRLFLEVRGVGQERA
jgi:paired amphipathic helix protein Sin3a